MHAPKIHAHADIHTKLPMPSPRGPKVEVWMFFLLSRNAPISGLVFGV